MCKHYPPVPSGGAPTHRGHRCKHLVRSKHWKQPWASPDLNSITALEADQRASWEIERWPTSEQNRKPSEGQRTHRSRSFTLPAGKCDFNEPLLNGHKALTLVCCLQQALHSGISWQPLHSPVSSLAVNHMFEELKGDISPLCAAPWAWFLERAEGHN